MGLRDWLGSKDDAGAEADDGQETVARARHLRQRGQVDEAWRLLIGEVERRPDDLEAVRELWDLAVQTDRRHEAAPPFLRHIARELRAGDADLAVFRWFELVDRVGEDPELDLETRLRLAEQMVAGEHAESAAALLEPAPEQLEASQPLALRLRLAMAAARSRSPATDALAEHVLAQPGLPDGHRRQLEEAVAEARAEGLRAPVTGPDEGPIELADVGPTARRLRVIPAVPTAVDAAALGLEIPGQGRRRLALSSVQAIAAARIDEAAGSAYVVVDLLVDSLWADREEVRTVRLRTCDFDPQALVPGAGDSQLALATLLENLLATSEAQPLPDAEAAVGRPFHGFASLREYESRVLELTSA